MLPATTNNTLTMEPGEALGIAAQIAVALAGFAGVVVVFRRESVHEWSAVDKLRLRLLLGNSILPLGLCMLGIAFADDQTDASRNLAMVQRYCIRYFFALRRHDDEILSAFGCATDTARTRHSLRFLSVRNVRHSSKPRATVQCCLARRILAILHLHRVPSYYRAVPICAHDPPAA